MNRTTATPPTPPPAHPVLAWHSPAPCTGSDQATATIGHACRLLQEGQYQEALTLLQTVADDEQAQNALGVALFNTGQMGRAIECFERAAQHGNDDARENLRQMYRQLDR